MGSERLGLGFVFVWAAALWACTSPGERVATHESKLDEGATPPIVTQHTDPGRTGWNLHETVLGRDSVASGQFHKVASLPVDGDVTAQPLWMPGLDLGDHTANVVFAATEANNVYAFDADSTGDGVQPIWMTSLGPPSKPLCSDVRASVGVTGTPVIDPATNTLYAVARTGDLGQERFFLHALDVTDGSERPGSPVLVAATVPGTGLGATADGVTFDATRLMQRPGLLLMDGVVYFAFGAFCDVPPYHGWVFGYDAATLQKKFVFLDTPNGEFGGIWQSGQGLATDGKGNIYLTSGNGTFAPDKANYGNAVVRLTPGAGPNPVTDYFAPFNVDVLNGNDWDFGSSGPMLVPGSNVLLAAGKEGYLYVLDRNDLGGLSPDEGQQQARIAQRFRASSPRPTLIPGETLFNHIHAAPVYWDRPGAQRLFLWAEDGDTFKMFLSDGQRFNPNPAAADLPRPTNGNNGGCLSGSSNGAQRGTGIVWATHRSDDDANRGVLWAFDAESIPPNVLWKSSDADGDEVGWFGKFNPPLVANGRVFVGTYTLTGRIQVYGLQQQ